ncbi:hypothetical protein ACFOU2_21880 [Bacillus songklensis]|uniref:Uncharacterized protein n=1 Tax=Bacillus songklensis TaxID=1069116 RepID=A0ABV8B808_9BACI
MWKNPGIALAACRSVAIEAFLQCLNPEFKDKVTVEVIYRRR